jgi:hypothetical protein
MTLADSAGGTFQLSLTGTGVAGYLLAGANAFWTTVGFAAGDLESQGSVLNQPVVGMALLNCTFVVVLGCHKAKPFAQVDGPPMSVPGPNTVIHRGGGDRWSHRGFRIS